MKRARSIALCVKPGGKSPMMGWSSTCDPIREPRRRKAVALRSRVCRRISCHWRRAVPSQAPISLADARRQAHARPASSVGSQSLLLSKPYPHQRCGHPRAQRRSRLPPRLAQTHPRSRRRRHQARRHREMAVLSGSHRPSSRASSEWRRHPPRHALCRAGLRGFRFHTLASRSRSLLTHRTLLEKIDCPAHGSPPPALSVALEWPRLFHWPPDASPGRFRLRSSMGPEARTHPRTARASPRRPPRQVRHPLGSTRRAIFRLRKSRLAPTRRLRPEREKRVTPDLQSHPRLAPGCRLGENNQQRVLLMPERALRLNGPSLEIVERCDGKRSVRQIIVDLQQIYSKAAPGKVEQDILGYLGLLHDQRALDFITANATQA